MNCYTSTLFFKFTILFCCCVETLFLSICDRYYEFHGLHAAAANQLYQLAHVERDEKDESGNVIGSKGTVFPVNFRLENRILLLQHAAISAQIASVEQESGGWNDRSLGLLSNGNSRQTVSYSEFLGEIQDELTIAGAHTVITLPHLDLYLNIFSIIVSM